VPRLPTADLASAKAGQTVSVCLPARDEAATVGAIVREAIALEPLVDEVIVVDDASVDGTAAEAAAAGARVVPGAGTGKGRAMWMALAESTGDLIVYCDADVRTFGGHFVTALLGPLLEDHSIALVKATYERPFGGRAGEGGRVNELMARPLLRVLFPDLGFVDQPLGGECAGRRKALAQLPFVEGWGVDIGLVLDVAARFGPAAIAQVDLGRRVHRNRPLAQLGPPAEAVLRTALARAGLGPPVPECRPLVEMAGSR